MNGVTTLQYEQNVVNFAFDNYCNKINDILDKCVFTKNL